MKKRYGAAVLFVALMIFWFILSFQVTIWIAIIGAIVSIMVVLFNLDMIFNNQEVTKMTFKKVMMFFVLLYILVINIIKSNIEVAKIVMSKDMPIDPGFVKIKQKLNKELNQALYANAITLTPGTLTVDMDHEFILVHGLVKSSVKDLEGSALEKAFLDLEGEKND